MNSQPLSYRTKGGDTTQSSGKIASAALFSVGMSRVESPSRQPSVREPSPPFVHVSWREEVEHDAAAEVTSLAETVMGRDAEPSRATAVPTYLAKIARYPLWAISVRALFGAALVPVPAFLYAGTRYHYFAHAGAQYHIDQNALLAGVTLALGGALVGMAAGALWGWFVVRHARRKVAAAS
jgi:hypothetical protein